MMSKLETTVPQVLELLSSEVSTGTVGYIFVVRIVQHFHPTFHSNIKVLINLINGNQCILIQLEINSENEILSAYHPPFKVDYMSLDIIHYLYPGIHGFQVSFY